MVLPCVTCKFSVRRTEWHRVFIGCKDEQLKKDNFIEDDLFYHHKCKAYEKQDAPQDNNVEILNNNQQIKAKT